MFIFKILRTLMSGLVLGVIISSVSFQVMAKRPVSASSSDCLSGKAFNLLAKSALSDLQLIDSTLTLTDVKQVLHSAGDCATLYEYDLVLEQYTKQISNTVPVIEGVANSSISKGGFYIFTPTASDADGDELLFSVQNLPSWAQFDANTGTILGVPMADDVRLYEDIVISVSDGIALTSLAAINIEVFDNQLAGPLSPQLAEIAGYSIYMGTSTDNLSNLVSLDVDTVTDIQVNHTLSTTDTYYFYIVARDINGNNILLSDNEISGYRVYIGMTSEALSPVYNFADGVNRIYLVNNLVAGTYFVSITTYDTNGNETPLSNIAQFDLI